MKKLLIVILFSVGIATAASAVEVINVDLNAYNDDAPYSGQGAYVTGDKTIYDDGTSRWLVYYEGYGRPIYSPSATNLHNWDEGNIPSAYAAQVWIGDDGIGHSHYKDSNVVNNLLNDGFLANASSEPNIDLFGYTRTYSSYGGTFDIYVYGARAGSFKLTYYEPNIYVEPNRLPDTNIIPADGNTWKGINESQWVTVTKTVSGGGTDFNEGQNYVVFQAVDINVYRSDVNFGYDGNDWDNVCTVTDSNNRMVILSYTGSLNGLQLVSKKQPIPIVHGAPGSSQLIAGGNWYVSADSPRDGEYDGQYGSGNIFGPDITNTMDPNWPGPHVGILEKREYMGYDISVDGTNQGEYAIALICDPYSGDVGTKEALFDIYLDGRLVGHTYRYAQNQGGPGDVVQGTSPAANVNLFAGVHQVKWVVSTDTNATGDNVFDVNLTYIGDVNEMNNCDDIYTYNLQFPGDLNGDCLVDVNDLDIMTELWLYCYDPNVNNCQ